MGTVIIKFVYKKLIILITLIIGIMSILGYLSSYINPNYCGIIPFFNLMLPILLPLNLILLLYWSIKKQWLLLLPTFSILLNVNFILAMLQPPYHNTDSTKKQNQLKIVSYNVMNFTGLQGNNTIKNIANFLQKEETDIICFQEYCENSNVNLDSICRILKFLPYHKISHIHTPPYANFGLAIFSKYPIINSGECIFSKLNSSMWVDILTQNDTIRVFNNHLQKTDVNEYKMDYYQQNFHGNIWKNFKTLFSMFSLLKQNFQIRANQVNNIRHLIDTTRHSTIICGDLNDIPCSYTYQRLKGKLKDGFKTCGNGYASTYSEIGKLLRIDYIFYSNRFKANCYTSPSLPWSDHNPVMINVQLRNQLIN